MKKIGIIICGRYQNCGAGKCLRGLKERKGGFAAYPADEELELVGFAQCGGCPGGNIEYVPAEMVKNGADSIHLATCLVVGYPPCPRLAQFKEAIEVRFQIPVIVGTHPLPMKYWKDHQKLSFWGEGIKKLAPYLFDDTEENRLAYD